MAVTWAVVWKVLGALVLILPVTAYVAGRVAGPPDMATFPAPVTDSPASNAPRHPTGPSSSRDQSTYVAASPRSGSAARNEVGAGSTRVGAVPQRPDAKRHETQRRLGDHAARIQDTIRVVPDRPTPGTPSAPMIVLPDAPATATPNGTTPGVPEAPAPGTPTGAAPGGATGDTGGGSPSDGGSDLSIVPVGP